MAMISAYVDIHHFFGGGAIQELVFPGWFLLLCVQFLLPEVFTEHLVCRVHLSLMYSLILPVSFWIVVLTLPYVQPRGAGHGVEPTFHCKELSRLYTGGLLVPIRPVIISAGYLITVISFMINQISLIDDHTVLFLIQNDSWTLFRPVS